MTAAPERLASALADRYTIERELGAGGMATVYLAEDVKHHRKVAIKVLRPDLAAVLGPERFKQEIEIAARLQHPHVLPVHDSGDVDGVLYYVMPYVQGESLRERLSREGELPVPEAVRLLREVGDALAYAHSQGVVHRDIKPENIMLSGHHALVMDFGVAKAVSDARGSNTLTTAGVALGTPAYMAPEQAAADPHVDHRADIYAFGVVGYELLAGRPPFVAATAQQLIAAHVTQTPDPVARYRPAVPLPLAAVIMKALEKRPADRWQTAAEMVAELQPLATSSGGMSPAGATVHARRFATNRSWLRVAMYAAGVGVIVAGGVWAAMHHDHGVVLNSHRIVVAPCENLTGDTALAQVGRIAGDYLTQQIAQTGALDVVSGTTVAMITSDAKSAQGDIVPRLATATHAGSVVTCSVTKTGDSLRVEARIVDARTGTIRRALAPGIGPVSDPIAAIGALRERLLGALVSGDMANRLALAGDAPKYTAYQTYLDGMDRFTRYQDFRGARPLFEKAVAIDSTFTRAYLMLAFTYRNVGEFDDAERVVAVLAGRRDRLSAFDRLDLDLIDAMLRGDNAAAVRAAEGQVARDSNAVSELWAGTLSLGTLHAADALAALKASDSAIVATGWWPEVVTTSVAYHLLGDYRDELARLERGRREFPNELRVTFRELSAFAGLRQPRPALALADTLLREAAGPNAVTGISDVFLGVQEFGAHGDSATARQLARMALDWVRANPSDKPTRGRQVTEARIWLMNGQLDSARTHFMAVVADTSDMSIGGYLGIIAARQGDGARAMVLADSIGSLKRKWTLGLELYWRGAILAWLGRKDEAVALLKQAAAHGQGMDSWHYAAPLSVLHGYAPFEALLAVRQ